MKKLAGLLGAAARLLDHSETHKTGYKRKPVFVLRDSAVSFRDVLRQVQMPWQKSKGGVSPSQPATPARAPAESPVVKTVVVAALFTPPAVQRTPPPVKTGSARIVSEARKEASPSEVNPPVENRRNTLTPERNVIPEVELKKTFKQRTTPKPLSVRAPDERAEKTVVVTMREPELPAPTKSNEHSPTTPTLATQSVPGVVVPTSVAKSDLKNTAPVKGNADSHNPAIRTLDKGTRDAVHIPGVKTPKSTTSSSQSPRTRVSSVLSTPVAHTTAKTPRRERVKPDRQEVVRPQHPSSALNAPLPATPPASAPHVANVIPSNSVRRAEAPASERTHTTTPAHDPMWISTPPLPVRNVSPEGVSHTPLDAEPPLKRTNEISRPLWGRLNRDPVNKGKQWSETKYFDIPPSGKATHVRQPAIDALRNVEAAKEMHAEPSALKSTPGEFRARIESYWSGLLHRTRAAMMPKPSDIPLPTQGPVSEAKRSLDAGNAPKIETRLLKSVTEALEQPAIRKAVAATPQSESILGTPAHERSVSLPSVLTALPEAAPLHTASSTTSLPIPEQKRVATFEHVTTPRSERKLRSDAPQIPVIERSADLIAPANRVVAGEMKAGDTRRQHIGEPTAARFVSEANEIPAAAPVRTDTKTTADAPAAKQTFELANEGAASKSGEAVAQSTGILSHGERVASTEPAETGARFALKTHDYQLLRTMVSKIIEQARPGAEQIDMVRFEWAHEELGAIKFAIRTSGERVQVEIVSASAELAESIDSGRGALQAIFLESGLKLERLDVRAGSFEPTADRERPRPREDGNAHSPRPEHDSKIEHSSNEHGHDSSQEPTEMSQRGRKGWIA
jgi:DNA-directed RNA polymerase subunit L